MADALLIIFKTNSSVTDSKVSKGFSANEVSGQAVGFGGGKKILMVQTFGRLSELNVEGRGEDLLLPRMVLKF